MYFPEIPLDYGLRLVNALMQIQQDGTFPNPILVDDFMGCNEKELQVLRKYLPCKDLPFVYKEFLKALGHSDGGWFMGDFYFQYEYLEKIQKAIKQIQAENARLPESLFCFATYDFVEYYYFETQAYHDNPPVFWLRGSNQEPILYQESLNEFFLGLTGEVGYHPIPLRNKSVKNMQPRA